MLSFDSVHCSVKLVYLIQVTQVVAQAERRVNRLGFAGPEGHARVRLFYICHVFLGLLHIVGVKIDVGMVAMDSNQVEGLSRSAAHYS